MNNNSKITFAIDLDEVLRCTLCKMLEVYNREFKDDKQYDDVKSFVVEESFPRIEKETGINPAKWFFQDHADEIFEQSDVVVGAREAIEVLQQYGKVIIVTYQKSLKNKLQALDWLERHGFPTDNICFLKDKTIVHTTFLVDDNDWNFVGCNAQYGVLVNAPYSKDKPLKDIHAKSNCKKMMAVNSIAEFANILQRPGLLAQILDEEIAKQIQQQQHDK